MFVLVQSILGTKCFSIGDDTRSRRVALRVALPERVDVNLSPVIDPLEKTTRRSGVGKRKSLIEDSGVHTDGGTKMRDEHVPTPKDSAPFFRLFHHGVGPANTIL